MKIENPFETGHIRNYILLYASVVVIMILFFFASTLFNEVKEVETKKFSTELNATMKAQTQLSQEKEEHKEQTKFKLLDKAY
jgi:hypothetical protein